jgi:3-deoxy-manno-octulosonate cytidylyltransferase (CMP-KDO synthetase)
LDQGSGPECRCLEPPGGGGKMSPRNRASAPHPQSAKEISVCPCSGNPYKRAEFNNPRQSLAHFNRVPMSDTSRTLVLIPARMASTRLPGKPLMDIAGLPMIVHVLRSAEQAGIGRVAVATDTPEIAAAVKSHGGDAVMTRADHPSGSDRIFEALEKLDPRREVDIVVNLQGDFPTIATDNIRDVLGPLGDPAVDIATLAAEIHTEEEGLNPNVVKAVGSPIGGRRMRALYFTRATAPWGDGPRYHHIGLYAYRRAALERFVSLPPSPLEQQEKLEQLRALEAGMRIDITIVETVPRGVDTPADLETARRILAKA